MFVMFTYDVPAERTVKFRKLLRRYLGHEQFSVFFGEQTAARCDKLRLELRKLVSDRDRVLEFVAENRHNVDIAVWSKAGRIDGVPQVTPDERHKQDSLVI